MATHNLVRVPGRLIGFPCLDSARGKPIGTVRPSVHLPIELTHRVEVDDRPRDALGNQVVGAKSGK